MGRPHRGDALRPGHPPLLGSGLVGLCKAIVLDIVEDAASPAGQAPARRCACPLAFAKYGVLSLLGKSHVVDYLIVNDMIWKKNLC